MNGTVDSSVNIYDINEFKIDKRSVTQKLAKELAIELANLPVETIEEGKAFLSKIENITEELTLSQQSAHRDLILFIIKNSELLCVDVNDTGNLIKETLKYKVQHIDKMLTTIKLNETFSNEFIKKVKVLQGKLKIGRPLHASEYQDIFTEIYESNSAADTDVLMYSNLLGSSFKIAKSDFTYFNFCLTMPKFNGYDMAASKVQLIGDITKDVILKMSKNTVIQNYLVNQASNLITRISRNDVASYYLVRLPTAKLELVDVYNKFCVTIMGYISNYVMNIVKKTILNTTDKVKISESIEDLSRIIDMRILENEKFTNSYVRMFIESPTDTAV